MWHFSCIHLCGRHCWQGMDIKGLIIYCGLGGGFYFFALGAAFLVKIPTTWGGVKPTIKIAQVGLHM